MVFLDQNKKRNLNIAALVILGGAQIPVVSDFLKDLLGAQFIGFTVATYVGAIALYLAYAMWKREF